MTWGVLTRSDLRDIREQNEKYKNYDFEYDIYLFGHLLVKSIEWKRQKKSQN